MLKQRVIFGVIGALLMIGVLVFCPAVVTGVLIGIISLIGLGEFYNVTGLIKSKSPAIIPGFIFTFVIFATAIFYPQFLKEYIMIAVISYVFLLMMITVIFHEKNSYIPSGLHGLVSGFGL